MAKNKPLSAEMKQAIKDLYATGEHTQEKLARLFKTSQSNISNIIRDVRSREYSRRYRESIAHMENPEANEDNQKAS